MNKQGEKEWALSWVMTIRLSCSVKTWTRFSLKQSSQTIKYLKKTFGKITCIDFFKYKWIIDKNKSKLGSIWDGMSTMNPQRKKIIQLCDYSCRCWKTWFVQSKLKRKQVNYKNALGKRSKPSTWLESSWYIFIEKQYMNAMQIDFSLCLFKTEVLCVTALTLLELAQ